MEKELFNTNYELCVLSSLIFDDASKFESSEINPFNFLKCEDFYQPFHQEVFNIMLALMKQDINPDEDFITTQLKIKDYSGWPDLFLRIITTNPVSNIIPYMRELKEYRKLRDAISLSTEIKKKVLDNSNSVEVYNFIDKHIENILSIENSFNQIINAEDLLKKYENEPSIKRVKTNFPLFDIPLDGGFDEGGLVVITGEPETGKSHISYSIAERASNTNKVGIISLEFGDNDYASRLKQLMTNSISLNIENIELNFSSFSIDQLIETLYRMAHAGVKLVVIDSLHKISNNIYINSSDRVNDSAQKIDQVCKKTGMVIILIAQGSKDDNIGGRMGVLYSVIVPHLAKVFLRVEHNKSKNERTIHWHKNKQTRKYPIQKPIFQSNGEILIEGSVEIFQNSKKPIRHINI